MQFITVRIGLAGLAIGVAAMLMPWSVYAQDADTPSENGINPEAVSQIGTDPVSGFPGETRRLPVFRPGHMTHPFPRKRSSMTGIDISVDRVRIELDSLGNYVAQREIDGIPVGYPRVMDFETFASVSFEGKRNSNWVRLVEERRRQRDARRGLLDFTIELPVGERSAFTTIFGRPEVNLQVTGTANMNIGASIRDTEDPSLPPDQQRRIDPTFQQNLRLNIQGSIGDKLFIRTDWDTERAFDFENRLSIRYQGYEDEILQSIDMGNVSMQTGNSLISGGSALFGIKTETKFGPLTVTTVLSQKEGQGNTQTITGGSQESTLEILPAAYDNDRHFFLDFYAYQEFEGSMSNPIVGNRLFNITRMDVYVLNSSTQEREGQRNAVALVDLGVNQQGETFFLPHPDADQFDDALMEAYRDPEVTPSASDFGVPNDEFVEGDFEPLEEGVDYTFNENNGFISLDTRLSSNQALAISFTYDAGGESIDVGDINVGDDQRMFLKLLRPWNMTTSSKAWILTMRNIYNLSATNLTPDDLEAEIIFDGSNTEQTNLPGLGNILLQDLGLDRVNSQGETTPDNQIDFGTGTLDAVRGRIIFPYLEPFGRRIVEIYEASGLSQAQIEENIEQYAFTELYTNTQESARQKSGNNLYKITGISKGSAQDSYNLGFAIVEGSVRVTASGVELSEGLDYEVDYSIGNIMIINDRYLQSGQEIVIDYESNQMMQIQQTSFAGVRAEYRVSENIRFGSTYFTLRERPLQDKIPIGDEPISNSIIGFDGNAQFNTPWITRAINWIPLFQTRADSDIRISGEFAQLRPNVAQTRAVARAIERNELYDEEEHGLSFIDDFEGSKTSINFMSPGRWNIAAAPHAIPGFDLDMDFEDNSLESRVARSDLRVKFSWYMIPVNISRITDAARTPESLPVSVSDVFPNREVLRQEDRLQTLDIHYDPLKRGPYNYHPDLRDVLENRPQDTWGGMTTTLPSGLDNLTQNNIEFLEFWVQPLLPEGRFPGGTDIDDYDGKIYIDVGLVSEDVIPNNVLNTEDGLARAQDRDRLRVDNFGRSYVISSGGDLTGQFSVDSQVREDVGLDGAHSFLGENSEQVLYADWLEMMEIQFADQPEILDQIRNDPSNDQYVYFNDPLVSHLPLHERFHRMYGFLEGNSISQGESRANTNRPDTEGLINPASVNRENSYFQFEIPLNPADTSSIDIGSGYIVDKVDGDLPTDRWYLVRIPLRDQMREVGTIESLERVSHIRFWMSGYSQPMTLRFATFELVGNQWRQFEDATSGGSTNTVFEVATINIEENSNRQPIPYRIPNGAIRSVQRGQQEQILANEQSLSLRVEDLRSGETRLIQRLYPNGLNLLNYSNMRMFVHGEGYERRTDAEIVIRLGNDLTNNYYEYRQPVSPTDPSFNFTPLTQDPDASVLTSESDRIWLPDSNSINLVLSSLNALKQSRDIAGFDDGTLYERSDLARNAPPGTVIAIKGNPSLERVREIGIGIRNPHAGSSGTDNWDKGMTPAQISVGRPSLDAEFWINEMRVSGFDDKKGWAANLRTDVRMADLATVRANVSRQTDGFGPLSASLGNRYLREQFSYGLSTTISLHRFVPERYGWNFPVSLSANRRQETPRFLPHQGDTRFLDFREAVESSDLSEQEKERQISDMLNQIRDHRQSYSLNLSNISKSGSQSALLRHTVDNTTLGYAYSISEESSPRTEFKDSWDYRASFNYRLSIRNINIVRPLIFLDGVPVLRWIAGTGFTYVPSSISFGSNLSRRYSEERRRSLTEQPFDLQQQHNFDFRTNFSLNYNFTQSISTAFSNQSQHNLQGMSEIPLESANGIGANYRLKPTFNVLENWLLKPSVSPRRDNYQESWRASWRPRLNRISGLDWMNYSVSFQGSFAWQNSPEGSGLGANLNNSYSLDHSPEIRTQTLLRKLPFYNNAIEADEAERKQREAENRRRQNDSEEAVERELNENLRYYGRRLMLSLLSMQTLNVTYNRGESSSQGGYAGSSELYNMFGDEDDSRFSPPFGYRIGLINKIPLDQIIRNPDPDISLSLRSVQREQNQLNVRSGLRPTTEFSVNLDWRTSWDETFTQNQTLIYPDILSVQHEHSGSIATTVWAFGDGYRELLNLQLIRAGRHIRDQSIITGVDEGDIPLTAGSLEKDFRDAYLGYTGKTIGSRNYMPVPLPNWTVTWSGLEKYIGFMKKYIQRVSLRHTYQGRYRQGWQLNPNSGDELNRSIGQYRFFYEQPEFNTRSISLERSFSPLVGLNFTWVNNLRTQIQYNNGKQVSISFSNNTITERNSQGITGSIDYTKRGFKIPFFRELNNQIQMNLTMNYSENLTLTYRLNEDIVDGVQYLPNQTSQFVPANPDERGDARIQVRPSVKYQFSRTINAGFEYTLMKHMPRSTGTYPRTDQDIRFNVQISIRSD